MKDGNVAGVVRSDNVKAAMMILNRADEDAAGSAEEVDGLRVVHGNALLAYIEELERRLSDGSPAWRDAANDPPDNEQKVLACWRGPSCVEGMETLVYRGPEGSDDPECWFDVWSDVRDAPTHWMPLPEAPK